MRKNLLLNLTTPPQYNQPAGCQHNSYPGFVRTEETWPFSAFLCVFIEYLLMGRRLQVNILVNTEGLSRCSNLTAAPPGGDKNSYSYSTKPFYLQENRSVCTTDKVFQPILFQPQMSKDRISLCGETVHAVCRKKQNKSKM